MKKLNNLFSPLKNLDIYGVPIRVNFQNKEIYKTGFGATISLIVFTIFGFSCYFFSCELYQRNNPIVVTSEQYVKTPQRMDIDKIQQVIVMGFNDINGQAVYDPSVIQAKATIYNMKRVFNETTQQYENNIQKNILRLRPCNTQDIKVDKVKQYFNQISLPQYFCFDDNQEVYLQGEFFSDIYTRVDVYFSQCQNSTQPNSSICKTQEQINKITSKLHFLVYMMDKIVDPSNFDNPFDYQGMNIETYTSIFQSQLLTAYFENYYIQSDIGIFQKSVNQIRDFLYAQSTSSNVYGQDGLIIQFSMRPYKQKQIIMERRYMKLVDLVAQLGGILKLATLIGFIIAYPFAKINFKKQIINSIFDCDFSLKEVESKNNNNNNQNLKQIQMDKTNNVKSQMIGGNIQFPLIKNIQEQEDLKSTIYNHKSQSDSDHNISSFKRQFEMNKNEVQVSENKVQPKQENKNINTAYSFQSKNKSEIDGNNSKDQSFFSKRKSSQYKRSKKSISMEQSKRQTINNSGNQNLQDSEVKLSILDRFKRIFNPNKQKINFGCLEYFQYFVTLASSNYLKLKKIFVLKGYEQVQKNLDIQYILQKLQEIEKLKSILLNDDQIKLFELLPRPVLKSGNFSKSTLKQNQLSKNYNISQEEKVNKAYESLINILNQKKKTQRDHQLIQLLDDQMYQTLKSMGLLSTNIHNLQLNQSNHKPNKKNNKFQNDYVKEDSNSFVNYNNIDSDLKEVIINTLMKSDVPDETQITNTLYFNEQRYVNKNSLNLF
ncbi:zinc knuckle protein, putative (macronuclear) [Tetrahymena thermophila SB210]|uniref:Zinc knuckle protein, putative n=1 Tax=Tetrahymena thermophila (strain SB210) TaxID=312017 RepID=Q22C98_TETTS|nr:zinc knuckle protein, putative [Tetrahymena thermophila SB210]EAR82909.2 zinc knuckle protein, putative [Tetrahymena thermophila SB210]|eukprot:XP_001030572.2 zinc knuckle protein, putative [Tetrahymena thermophila SB210]